MEDRTPERGGADEGQMQLTPETPETPVQPPLQMLLESPAQLMIPSSLFRPWDTPESLSPTSSNGPAESLSPTSSNSSAPSDTSSPPSNLSPNSSNSSPAESSSEISPSQAVFGSNGNCLFRIEPLESIPGQGVFHYDKRHEDVKQDNFDFISGDAKKSRKRKRKGDSHSEAASPVLSRKQRGVSRGDFPPCGVCDEESTGVHYGASVCEGCKGFFRRRVVYRDVPALVCGTGGTCSVSGKGRIHCKLCRYNRCINIGMKPSAIKQEIKVAPSNMTFEELVLRCHKESMTPIPAIYLARHHTENINSFVAGEWPQSADLGSLASPGPGCGDSLRFVRSLPGWGEMSGQDQQWSLSTGAVQVMLARLLSRYRPEVGAFLFPCGQFVYPQQLVGGLSELTVASLTSLAHNMASRGLTQQEMALVSALLATNPLSCSQLYRKTVTSISERTSSLQLTDLAMQISELAWTSSPESWTNITLSQ